VRRALFVLDRGGTLGIPELRQLEFEIFRRVQVVLKQKLHCAFARFASFAHNQSLKPKAQSLKSKVAIILILFSHPHRQFFENEDDDEDERIKILRMKVGKLFAHALSR